MKSVLDKVENIVGENTIYEVLYSFGVRLYPCFMPIEWLQVWDNFSEKHFFLGVTVLIMDQTDFHSDFKANLVTKL